MKNKKQTNTQIITKITLRSSGTDGEITTLDVPVAVTIEAKDLEKAVQTSNTK